MKQFVLLILSSRIQMRELPLPGRVIECVEHFEERVMMRVRKEKEKK
jgi:hypothetical protein